MPSVRKSKQATFDNLPDSQKGPNHTGLDACTKKIMISELDVITKENELIIKIGFRLFPSKAAFSKITSELYFEGFKMNSIRISIPQGPLGRNDFDFTQCLDMQGIRAGSYIIKVELFEVWSTGEILTCTSKEFKVDYIPQKRQNSFVKVPSVKSIAGIDLEILTNAGKTIHQDMKENMRKELASKRDVW